MTTTIQATGSTVFDNLHSRLFGTDEPVVRKWLLLLVPALAAFGPMLPVVRPVYAFRVVVLMLLLATLLRGRAPRSASTTVVGRAVTWVSVVWVLSGMATGLLASDRHAAARDLLATVSGLVLLGVAFRAGTPQQLLRWLSYGWVIGFLATSAVGTLEITAHLHMSNYAMAPYLAQGLGEELSAGPFGNPDLYALYLAVSTPVLLYLLTTSRRRSVRAIYVAMTLWLFLMLLYTGGRLGIVATVIAVGVWLVCTRRIDRWAAVVVALGLAAMVLMALSPQVADDSPLPHPPAKLSATSGAEIVPSSADPPNSGNVRVGLMAAGWDMIEETRGFGVGPGNYPAWIQSHGRSDRLGGVLSPHNGVFELAAQYGVIAALAAFGLFILTVREAVRRGIRPRGPSSAAAVLVISTATAFPILALCSSTFWTPPATWSALAVFLVAGAVAETSGQALTPAVTSTDPAEGRPRELES